MYVYVIHETVLMNSNYFPKHLLLGINSIRLEPLAILSHLPQGPGLLLRSRKSPLSPEIFRNCTEIVPDFRTRGSQNSSPGYSFSFQRQKRYQGVVQQS